MAPNQWDDPSLWNEITGCPKELQVVGGDDEGGGVVACKSACEAFRLDQYCCSGEFANPTTCRPSFYSAIFKGACPRAYSYAFDDATSTFTCKANDYGIVFCPTVNGYTVSPLNSYNLMSYTCCLSHHRTWNMRIICDAEWENQTLLQLESRAMEKKLEWFLRQACSYPFHCHSFYSP